VSYIFENSLHRAVYGAIRKTKPKTAGEIAAELGYPSYHAISSSLGYLRKRNYINKDKDNRYRKI
jgi:hypothetical protein